MTERTIPDVWEVFGKQRAGAGGGGGGGGVGGRRNSWQKMMTEEERTVTELFSDLHMHANTTSYTAGSTDSAVDLDSSDADADDDDQTTDSKNKTHNVR